MSEFKHFTLAVNDTLTAAQLPGLTYPVLASPKIDGYRCGIQQGQAISRSGIKITNEHAYRLLSALPEGLDGELTVGPAMADNVFNTTSSALRTASGQPEFVFNVFDIMGMAGSYTERLAYLQLIAASLPEWVKIVPQHVCENAQQVMALEEQWVSGGWEGLMVRNPREEYLHQRSSDSMFAKGRSKMWVLFRFKRFYTSEFVVTGIREGLANNNPAYKDKLGYLKRDGLAEHMVPNGQCGGLIGYDLHSKQEFTVAPGKMTKEQAIEIFQNQAKYVGHACVYRFDKKGGYTLPRFPTFQGWWAGDETTKVAA